MSPVRVKRKKIMAKVKYIKEKKYSIFGKTIFKTREEYEEVSVEEEPTTPVFFVLNKSNN